MAIQLSHASSELNARAAVTWLASSNDAAEAACAQLCNAGSSQSMRTCRAGVAHLLVAPMMKTVFLLFMPSISVSSWFSTRSAAPPASPALAAALVGDGVQLVEEQHARRALPGLVRRDLAHVGRRTHLPSAADRSTRQACTQARSETPSRSRARTAMLLHCTCSCTCNGSTARQPCAAHHQRCMHASRHEQV